jgi:hypothetical protein
MSAAEQTCFYTFDVSGFQGLPFALALKYKHQWDTFNRIQAINLRVSTLRKAGNLTESYYQFISYTEQSDFTMGQFLHQRRYPGVNWNSVPTG